MRTADATGQGGPARDVLEMARDAGIELSEENLAILSKEYLIAREMRRLVGISRAAVCQACEKGYIPGAFKQHGSWWAAPTRGFLAWRLTAQPYHGDSEEMRQRKLENARCAREAAAKSRAEPLPPAPEPEPPSLADPPGPDERRIDFLRERARRHWGEQEQP